MSLVVGLTGGIGSGKSTVADMFAKRGAPIIDTDTIAHQLTQAGGDAIQPIRAAFGSDYITENGALDRAKMRALIFSDAAANRRLDRKRLEGILHPLIRDRAKAQLLQSQAAPYVILVVPLLPESPAFRQLAQRILVVDCDEATQIARVVERSRMREAEVRAIIASQTPRAARLQLADDVISNNAGLDILGKQINTLHEYYSNTSNNN
jgi:dephospho-CoA kinase